MSEIEASIDRVIEAYRASVAARDIDAFMHLYDPTARVFDAWGVWSYETVPAWRVAVEGWFVSHPADRFSVVFEDVRSVSTPAFASVSAIVTYAVHSARGEQLNAMQNRLTWVLKTSGHVPRIIHEHTSAPVGFDDQKAILQRASKP
ncbi:YybH family protein [Rivibacter subsaxonicus]|uniref:YybH family protein n=1 Tax=Rivibacter subsaxonicus TaxID=457575 RepID=UPI0013EE7D81|nr:nuclear transport factor 2 family protein [Rivibacter subsaxonicus]